VLLARLGYKARRAPLCSTTLLALLGIRSYLLMSRQPEFGAAVAGIAI
jgi:hypothetical protein